MAQFEVQIMPGRTGVIVAEGALADVYRRDPAYTEVLAAEQVEAMKGSELDEALAARGLPTGGKVSQRRARLLGEAEAGEAAAEAIAATLPDPGVLPPEETPVEGVPIAAAPVLLTGDRDAIAAQPAINRPAIDRDAEHSKEN